MIRRLVQRDLIYRVIRRPWNLLILLMPAVLLLLKERANILYMSSQYPEMEVSAGDLFVTMFSGMHTYVRGENFVFNIPYGWMLLMMGLTLTAANVATQDLETAAPIILLQSRKRKVWAVSRFLTGTIQVGIGYLLLIVSCLIGAVLYGGTISLLPTRYVVETLGMNLRVPGSCGIIYLMPLISILAIVHLQIMTELVTSSILGYIVVIVVLFASCYYSCFYMPGNGAMLIRSALGEDRIPMIASIITNGCIMVGAVGVGSWVFQKRDIR